MALVAAFLYLNFRFMQNVLLANFAVEIFYPLFIFSTVYFASKKKEGFYYLALLLGLLVKEDSVIYFGSLGLFFMLTPSHRRRGFITLLASVLYFVFILKVFVPWSGNDIFRGDIRNYAKWGPSPQEMAQSLLRRPWVFASELILPFEKVRTLWKLTSKLLFLPLLSPWFLLVLISLYPVFFQGGKYFVELAFHYGAPTLPFLFLALVDGLSRIRKAEILKKFPLVLGVGIGLLIFLNGFNLRPLHFDREDLKTISLAKSLGQESVVVTQGHLLPYLGYRKWNFYIAEPYGIREDTRQAYLNPDYFLFDFEANAYPLSPEQLRQMADSLKKDPRYEAVHEDGRRLLLKNTKF